MVQESGMYKTINEDGQLITRSTSEDKRLAALEDIKNTDLKLQLKKVYRFDTDGVLEDFKERAAAEIEEIQALEGALYTEEGKKAEISERVTHLAEQALQQLQLKKDKQTQRKAAALKAINQRIAAAENLTVEEARLIEFRYQELNNEIRGKLALVNNLQRLEQEYSALAANAENDDVLRRYLTKNQIIFFDRAKEISQSEQEVNQVIQRINGAAQRIKQTHKSKRLAALEYLRDDLQNREFSVQGISRQINHHVNHFLKQY